MTEYRHNHYVPIWYQRRFVPAAQTDQRLFYLARSPGYLVGRSGVAYRRKAVHRWGFKSCFVSHLYTAVFRGKPSTDVERHFFGAIDSNGRRAVDYFTAFEHPCPGGSGALADLLLYMSTQKFRTPKGLAYMEWRMRANGLAPGPDGFVNQNILLGTMMNLRTLFGATWAECCWQIADASQSETKFIVSDHPVTVYNKRCRPQSVWCYGPHDPDIRFHGTHTIFPLSLEKLLILTNLSWVRNPYQSPMGVRPHPVLGRNAWFHHGKIQTLRHLNEEEVRQINLIIKCRAYRYVAAAREEWLYPEKYVSAADWSNFGHGYLLMPDPRSVALGGEIMWGGPSGASAVDAFGRRP